MVVAVVRLAASGYNLGFISKLITELDVVDVCYSLSGESSLLILLQHSHG
ncbi:hypothetical protein NOC27_1714 [Nitrosococcus oceani AFC27]|nr:hypothetical protein NOC27_1714 [Nitrosococcus oceani AFC27]